MRSKTLVVAVICAFTGAMLLSGVATAEPGKNKPKNEKSEKNCKNKKGKSKKCKKGKKDKPVTEGKVAICHQTGNGSYHLIVVGAPAVKAHLRHGDAFPGAQVPGGTLDQNCQVPQPPPPQPQRYTSPVLEFGPNGWAGWSCPSGMKAVGGGHTLVDATAAGVAQPGATVGGSTYPTFPHYTFGTGETGFVVQNDNDTESGTVFVDCVPA